VITLTRRRLLLAAAFLAALVSAALAPSEEAAPPPAKRAGKAVAPSGAAPQAQRPAAREIEVPPVANYKRSSEEIVEVTDVFEARAVTGAAPPPPPKPVAPKLPFSYTGLIGEAGQAKAVLVQGDQLHIVKKGEQFGSYRVEEADAEKIVVTYLPLGERQTLTLGDPPK
jgi:hypothetical protein